MHHDAPLHPPVVTNPRRSGVPPIAVIVFEGRSVAGALCKPTWTICDRVVSGVGKWSERLFGDIGPVRVGVELGPGRAVLEIISAADLRHPGALHVGWARAPWSPAGAMILS